MIFFLPTGNIDTVFYPSLSHFFSSVKWELDKNICCGIMSIAGVTALKMPCALHPRVSC